MTGGQVFDPRTGVFRTADVATIGNKVAEISERVDGTAAHVIDCSGKIVTPGLVDMHTHVYDGVFEKAVPAIEAHLRRGVVAVVDAGSFGVSNFDGFRRYIVEDAPCRILGFINISSVGLSNMEVSEFASPAAVMKDKTIAVALKHPEIIKGVKVRLSRSQAGDNPLEYLKAAVEVGAAIGKPIMVHFGETACPLEAVLSELRSGDILTHAFHGKSEGLLQDGAIHPAAHDARSRGVLFDVGHGTTQLAYSVARTALESGFYPDTVGSDLSLRNWREPAYDLPTVMSKLLALGMPLPQVLTAATRRPAEILGIDVDGFGLLEKGGRASITVLDQLVDADILPDASDDRLPVKRLEPVMVVNNGELIETTPWRGLNSAAVPEGDAHGACC
ncbi:amidohydrolase/deacetylase family metallohydrolase [Rhodococcus erythropolis]|uniref:amidohydrolase/deacetylase family metallohydrolase n=1 Tax=Rhodococcus erythropolis TaxID=1833 RepID=UPI00159F6FD1|nr:amidohydrolase/deacetylase family metallohydrolase [Rhodococcus erythropolis]